MTSSELNRLLLFCGYSEVADFLNDNPLNRHLHKHFLRLMPLHQIEVPVVCLFNEIYYQAVRIDYDATPGVDIGSRYLRDSETQLHTQPATQLVYAVIWALLNNKPTLSFNEECFLSQLTPYITNSDFNNFAKQLSEEIKAMGIAVPNRFHTITCPVDGLPTFASRKERDSDVPHLVKIFLKSDDYDAELCNWQAYSESWCEVTGRFSHASIERLIALYTTPADQLRFVEMVQDACPREVLNSHTRYFAQLASRIRTGDFVAKSTGVQVKDAKQSSAVNVEVPESTSPLSINITIPTAQQVNINPQRVINRVQAENESNIK